MASISREPQLPCSGQTQAAIERWLREHAGPGTVVAVRYTIGGRVAYQRGRVARAESDRIVLAMRRSDGTFGPRAVFRYSGRNCWNPGSSQLVIPTEAVLAACDAYEDNGGSLPRPGWAPPAGNDPRRR
jgi:hypothetical protein